MKAVSALLILAFGCTQGVSITDCSCGSLCETKNACPDRQRHESSDDCCSRTRAKDWPATENCFHLEPQTELDQASTGGDPAPILVIGFVGLAIPVPDSTEDRERLPRGGLAPPSLDGPLFLLHSRLLI